MRPFHQWLIIFAACMVIVLSLGYAHCQTKGAPVLHGVTLTWNQNGPYVLNRVYSSTKSGGPYTLFFTSQSAISSYFINEKSIKTPGTMLYFVVTAVDSLGNETGYTNEISWCPRQSTLKCSYGKGTSNWCNCK